MSGLASPAPNYRWRLAALALTMLLPSLGTSIANVALPTLSLAFGAPFHAVQWVVIAYLLAVTTLVVVAGRFGDLFGRRRLLLAGIAVFALASAACGLAPNLGLLIAARAAQGLGAALLMALSVAAIGDVVPEAQTGRAMGLLGTVSAVGTALGPSLGGILLSHAGWPSLFFVMAALGIAALLFAAPLLPVDAESGGRRPGFDPAGMLVLTLSLSAYALATTAGAGLAVSLALAVAALAGLALFVRIEATVATPMVAMRVLGDRALATGLIAAGLVSAVVMASLVVGPFYLSGILGLAPAEVGLVMSVGPVIAALSGVPSGHLVDRFGAAAMTRAGLAGLVLGALLMTVLPELLGVVGYVGGIGLVTSGYALFQAANGTAIMTGVARDRRGVVSGLLALGRNLGLVTGASAMAGLFALGSVVGPTIGLMAGGSGGLQLTFAAAALLGGLALVLTLRDGRT